MRAMVELERAGVAILTLEDTWLPAQFGRQSTEPEDCFVWAHEYMDVQESGGVGLWLVLQHQIVFDPGENNLSGEGADE
jgi:hypothetical protein